MRRAFAGFLAGIFKRAQTLRRLAGESQMWEFHLSCMILDLSAALRPVMRYISLPHAAMTFKSCLDSWKSCFLVLKTVY